MSRLRPNSAFLADSVLCREWGSARRLPSRSSPGNQVLTKVRAEYAVSGFSADGFAKIAEGVDNVLGEQLQRFAETH